MADFGQLITDNIPRLRRYSRALVRDVHLADDLVQDCLERAWAKQHLWQNQGEIRPWLFTILHNIYANTARRYNQSPSIVPLGSVPERGVNGTHESKLHLRDLERALASLPDSHREVILLVGVEQLSYEETER